MRFPRGDGDGWTRCARGHTHWGVFGAAGLLLWHDGAVLLQHRAEWSHHGGTWGIPGGARMPDESAADAALREAAEEAGIDRANVRIRGERVLTHPDWSYTTVLADELFPVDPAVTDAESIELRWVPVDEVATLPLLPAFGDAWPSLRDQLDP